MRNVTAGTKLWFIITALVVVLVVTYIRFKEPAPPAVLVASTCRSLAPGMKRMGSKDGFQFDFTAEDFSTHEGCSDAPPIVCGFDLRPKNSMSLLDISFGSIGSQSMEPDPIRESYEHPRKRVIFDDERHRVGEDYWGYVDKRKRWRRVHLRGNVYVRYDSASNKDAEVFDRIINSACFLVEPEDK
jgi:hypothetical protein